MANKAAIIILIFIGLAFYALTLRGVYGNFPASAIKGELNQDTKPLELSPERGRYVLTVSLAEHRSFALTPELTEAAAPDVGYYDGRFYVYFAPGISLLAWPFYLIGKAYNIAQPATFAVISLFAIGNLVLLFAIARKLMRLPLSLSVLAALIFGFASTSWSYANTLYQHHVTTFLILSAFMAVWKYRSTERFGWVWGIYVWLAYAFAIGIDYPNAILMLPVMVYFLLSSFDVEEHAQALKFSIHKTIFATFIVFVALSVLHGYYNYTQFGDWKRLSGSLAGYKSIQERGLLGTETDAAERQIEELGEKKKNVVRFFAEDKLPFGFFTLTVSPDRGLFLFAPVFLLALAGIFLAWRRVDLETGILFGLIGVTVFLYSSWGDPWGGWAFGPRYLIPVMAYGSLFISYWLFAIRNHWAARLGAFALIAYSSAVALLGAITSNVVPPKVEAVALGAHYNFLRNWEFFQMGKSSSFAYNHYFTGKMTLGEFYLALYIPLMLIFAVVLFVLPKFEKQ